MKSALKKILTRVHWGFGRMMIMHHGFWFVDIPRTSSSSIRAELSKRFGRAYGIREYARAQVFPDHMPARELYAFLGQVAWSNIFTFTMVRNPWDRIFSMYNYRRKVGKIPRHWGFREYIHALAQATPNSRFFRFHGFRYGATDYVLGDNGQVLVDFIARYENRAEDLKQIADRLGFDQLGVLHLQRATPPQAHYSEFYDAEMKEIIRKLYAKDIELFGYEFEDTT